MPIMEKLRKFFIRVITKHLLKEEDVAWVVNIEGEFGISIANTAPFVYYKDHKPLRYKETKPFRKVFKREFGETLCSPFYESNPDSFMVTVQIKNVKYEH